jgi:hypothetical protein
MMDWLKATAAAFTAVSVLVGIFIVLLYGPFAFLVREPDAPTDLSEQVAVHFKM